MKLQHPVLKRRTKSIESLKLDKGTNNMKKTIAYLFAAVLLGALIMVVPVITIARVTTTPKNTMAPQGVYGEGLRQLEGGEGSPNSTINNSQVTALAICFIIAFLAYAIIGPKAPRRYNMRLGVPPY
jgi:hypothetical protein